jgi:hypothetical protein
VIVTSNLEKSGSFEEGSFGKIQEFRRKRQKEDDSGTSMTLCSVYFDDSINDQDRNNGTKRKEKEERYYSQTEVH